MHTFPMLRRLLAADAAILRAIGRWRLEAAATLSQAQVSLHLPRFIAKTQTAAGLAGGAVLFAPVGEFIVKRFGRRRRHRRMGRSRTGPRRPPSPKCISTAMPNGFCVPWFDREMRKR